MPTKLDIWARMWISALFGEFLLLVLMVELGSSWVCNQIVIGTASKKGTDLLTPTALAPKNSPHTGSRFIHQTSFASVHNISRLNDSNYKNLVIKTETATVPQNTIASKEDRLSSAGKFLILSLVDM